MGALARWFGMAICAAALTAPAASSAGDDVIPGAAGFVVHDAGETLREWCEVDAEGRTWLVLPDGLRFELVTSTSDPVIANPGDGSFHPFDPVEVRAALSAVRFPLRGLAARVFLLPYPRRLGLESAAAPGVILLSPGVLPIAREHQHAELVHELGHVLQYARLPDSDTEGWARYRRLRGIEGDAYAASSRHADRPHEIFAEDFRYLFGGPWANTSGTIENQALPLPDAVEGLEPFLLALGASPGPIAIRVTPNPARGALEFARADVVRAPLDVFDASGRRLAALPATAAAGGTRWHWDAADPRRPRAGVLFARVRGEAGPATRFAVLP